MGALCGGKPTSDSVTTMTRVAAILLAFATVLLFVAMFLPWWSLKVTMVLRTHLVVSTGFSSWGWLSFAAGLVALVVTTRLLVVPHLAMEIPFEKRLNIRVMAWATLAAGGAELLGNLLFINAAPRTRLGFGGSEIASHGVGLVIAIVCGLTFIICGLLMLLQRDRGAPSLRYKMRFLRLLAPAPRRLRMPCPD